MGVLGCIYWKVIISLGFSIIHILILERISAVEIQSGDSVKTWLI